MNGLEPAGSTPDAPCLRIYGRADTTLRASLDSLLGRAPCWVRDLSLGGARVETEQRLAPEQSVWLSIEKLRIFGTVKWVRGNLAGVQFEEKLPKPVVLKLRGEVVDPEALAEMEAMLAAQNWVVGTSVDLPKSVRLAVMLGASSKRSDQSLTGSAQAAAGFLHDEAPIDRNASWRAVAVVALSAAVGVLIGLGSILIV